MARKLNTPKKKTCYYCKFCQTCGKDALTRNKYYYCEGCTDFAWHSIFKSWNYNKKK